MGPSKATAMWKYLAFSGAPTATVS